MLLRKSNIVNGLDKNSFSADIRIEKNRITEIGDLTPKNGEESYDFSEKLVVPGLVNTHTHLGMTVLRGVGEDLPFKNWLFEEVFPREDKLTANDIYWSSMLGIMEMIRRGITFFIDMYMFCDQIAEAAGKAGIKGIITRGIQDNDGRLEYRLSEALDFIQRYDSSFEGRIKAGIGIHAPYTCSYEAMKKVAGSATLNNMPVAIHHYETPVELTSYPVNEMEKTGILDTEIVLAHCTNIDMEVMDTLARCGATVSLNTVSNQKLGNGLPNISEMKRRGVNLTLGTDSSTSNNGLDILKEANNCALIQKCVDPSGFKAEDVMDLLWGNAGKIAFVPRRTIEVDSVADLTVLDLNCPWYHPLNEKILFYNLLFAGNSGDVWGTMVDGKWLYFDKKFTTIDPLEVYRNVEKIGARLLD